jgi:putative ABC transport system permease protein
LLFGLGLTIATTLLVTSVPVMTLTRRGVATFLREGAGNSRRSGTLRRPSLRGLIVAAETALAMVLLVAAGLLLDSFMRMRSTPLGVNPDGVLTFWIRPSEASLPTDSAPAFLSRLLASIGSVPGVEAATVDGGAPVSGSASSTLIIANHPPVSPAAAPPVLRHYVGPDHFNVLGVPLLRGRAFDQGDVAGRPRVAIISQSAAVKFWPNRDPIGERIWFGGGSSFDSPERSAEIVGIVGDVAYQPLDAGANRADFYTPYQQFTYGARVVLVRTRGDPMAAVADIRRAVSEVDPDLPLVEVRTLHGLIADSWAHQRFDAIVFVGFGAVGLLLAAAGVFSVVSFAVRARTQEMGIRLALGAQPRAILRLVVGEGLVFPGIGLVAGVVGSVAVTRLLRGSLYQVAPGDPKVPLATLALLLVVAAWACYVPAHRATTIDPAGTLRAD